MKRKAMLVLAVAALAHAILFATIAIAGLKITEKHDGWQLTAGAKVTGYNTYAECIDAIRVLGPGDYKCKDVTTVKAEFTCDDVPMPALPTKINAEGFLEQPGIVVAALPDGTWGPTMQEGFVRGPGFPNCWVPGLVPYDPHWQAPDTRVGENDLSPSPWVYTVDHEWPIGGKCPSADPNLCYSPPHPPIPPAS